MSQAGVRDNNSTPTSTSRRPWLHLPLQRASALRQVLARLDTQQQALIMGHAVPMPVVIRTREYGPELYAAVGYMDGKERTRQTNSDKAALFGS